MRVFFPPFQQHSQRYIRKCLPCIERLSHRLEMLDTSFKLWITALLQEIALNAMSFHLSGEGQRLEYSCRRLTGKSSQFFVF